MIATSGVAGTANARTWYVKNDGTGDAPTIEAGIDSSVFGDTVLVGPGTYEICSAIWPKDGIVITSESGPFDTRLVPEPYCYPAYAIGCQFLSYRTEISGFWIEGFVFYPIDAAPISVVSCLALYLRNNVMINNDSTVIAIDNTQLSYVYIENNTLINDGEPGLVIGASLGYFLNNIIWGRAGEIRAAWWAQCNCMLDVSDAGNKDALNFQDDPQFCGTPENGNLFLQSDSPCAPGNTPIPIPDCGLVGALQVGCGDTPVRSATWGAMKSLFR
jgi:hypothetical protein